MIKCAVGLLIGLTRNSGTDLALKSVQTVTTGEIEIPSITEEPGEREEGAGEDHRSVVGRLEFG